MDNLKKKRKAFYKQSGLKNKKLKKTFQIDVNLKGFLISCNNNETQAIKEAYNVLNEYANKLYGHIEQDNSDSDDIETALQEQINLLKSVEEKRFQHVETNIKNTIFIKTTLPDPNDLLDNIFNSERPCNVRFILRMLPVVKTCRSNIESIQKMAEIELMPVFANLNPAPTFSTHYKIRNNNSLNRGMIFSVIARVISDINPIAKVHLDDPDVVIRVDVLQKITCLSILRHNKKYRKYNLHEMSYPALNNQAMNTFFQKDEDFKNNSNSKEHNEQINLKDKDSLTFSE